MPIKVISGLPGHGKTLRMLSILDEEAKKGERPIYVAGVDGLIDGEWTVLDDPSRWSELPDGALVFVDEAWKWFGHLQDARGAKTPQYVLDLAEHRHRGMDFVWTTQNPSQLYPFARSLIADHTHVVRKAGTSACELYNWPELQDDVKSSHARSRAHKTFWMHPKSIYGMYKSSSLHTIKPSIPRAAILLPLIFGVAALLFAAVGKWLLDKMSPNVAMAGDVLQSQAAVPPAMQTSSIVRRERASEDLRYIDPLAYVRPRVPGLQWTAPAYDDVPFGEPPRMFCYISHKTPEGVCKCVTEQMTKIALDDDLCRLVVEHGVYDPLQRRDKSGSRDRQQQQAHHQDRSNPAIASTRASTVSRPYIGKPYTPPPGGI